MSRPASAKLLAHANGISALLPSAGEMRAKVRSVTLSPLKASLPEWHHRPMEIEAITELRH
jgi:hypothetical protein